jgi:hypothetical protein
MLVKWRVVRAILSVLLFGTTIAVPLDAQNPMPQLPNAHSLGIQNQELVIQLLQPISTDHSHNGDVFSSGVLLPDNLKGALVEGKVTKVTPARRRRKAEIQFAFYALVIQNQNYALVAELEGVTNSRGVKDVDEEGQVIGKTSRKKTAFEIAACTAGAATCWKLSGSPACLLIAAACYGITQTVVTNGSNVEFQPGCQFTIRVR